MSDRERNNAAREPLLPRGASSSDGSNYGMPGESAVVTQQKGRLSCLGQLPRPDVKRQAVLAQPFNLQDDPNCPSENKEDSAHVVVPINAQSGASDQKHTSAPAANPLPANNTPAVRALTQPRNDPLEKLTEAQLSIMFPEGLDRRAGRRIRHSYGGGAVVKIDQGRITIRNNLGARNPANVYIRLTSPQLEYRIKELERIAKKIESWKSSTNRISRRNKLLGASMLGVLVSLIVLLSGGKKDGKAVGISSGIAIVSLVALCMALKNNFALSYLPNSYFDDAIESTNILEAGDIDYLNQHLFDNNRPGEAQHHSPISRRNAYDVLQLLKDFVFVLKAVYEGESNDIVSARDVVSISTGLEPIVLTTNAVIQIKQGGRESKQVGPILSVTLGSIALELPPAVFSQAIERFKEVLRNLEKTEWEFREWINYLLGWWTAFGVAEIVLLIIQAIEFFDYGYVVPGVLGAQIVNFLFLAVLVWAQRDYSARYNDVMEASYCRLSFLSDEDKAFLSNHIKHDEVLIAEALLLVLRDTFLPVLHDIQNKFYPDYSRALGLLPAEEDVPAPTTAASQNPPAVSTTTTSATSSQQGVEGTPILLSNKPYPWINETTVADTPADQKSSSQNESKQQAPRSGSLLYPQPGQPSSQSRTSASSASSQTTVGQGGSQLDVERQGMGQNADTSNNPTA